jgi:hypothetical protein
MCGFPRHTTLPFHRHEPRTARRKSLAQRFNAGSAWRNKAQSRRDDRLFQPNTYRESYSIPDFFSSVRYSCSKLHFA